MATKHQWMKKDLLHIFEYLIERGSTITSHPAFRGRLDRNRNLYANQITREANGNIAYRSVDFDLSGLSDQEIWARLDASKYNEVIEDNAAAAMMKMADKIQITD